MHIFAFRRQPSRPSTAGKSVDERGVGVPDNSCQIKEGISAALEQAEYDLIISDFTLPVTAELPHSPQQELQPDTPFIFVAGSIGEEQVVESLKSGATDFVLKNRLNRLGPPYAVHCAKPTNEKTAAAEERVRVQSSALEAVANGIILTDARENSFRQQGFLCHDRYALRNSGQNPGFLNSGKHNAVFSGLFGIPS